MEVTLHLKPVHGDRMEDLIRKSHPGMAHWAGTGPDDKTCRECISFMQKGHYSASNKLHGSRLKDAPCRKFQKMMGKKGNDIPPTASACKFFEQNDRPPTLRAAQ